MDAPREQSGSGGGLRYLTEGAAPDMLNQEKSHSCQAACARQLLRDAGVEISEADLLAKVGYYEGIGTIAEKAATELSILHPILDYEGGAVGQQDLALLFAHWKGAFHNAVIPVRLKRGK